MKGIVIYLFALVTCVSTVLRMRNIMHPCPDEATLSGVGGGSGGYKIYQHQKKEKKKKKGKERKTERKEEKRDDNVRWNMDRSIEK